MSSLAPQIRARLPRLVDAAGVRSRLSLVQPAATRARRTPFVVLVFGILIAGVVGLLLFNTQMQQGAFTATALQQKASALSAEQQGLQMQLQRLRNPQRLAEQARSLGMVAPANPAFINLRSGHVLGVPTAATPANGIHVRPFAAAKPKLIAPKARIVHVPAKANSQQAQNGQHATTGAAKQATKATKHRRHTTSSTTSRNSQRSHGAASTGRRTTQGMKGGNAVSTRK